MYFVHSIPWKENNYIPSYVNNTMKAFESVLNNFALGLMCREFPEKIKCATRINLR